MAGTPVYRRILELFEAEGINTLFGIPDPNFVHMFLEAEQRGWTVVAPHHEAAAGFMAEAASRMTGKPAVCIGTLGPGIANAAPAMHCALVENSPVIFLSGQRARVTEQRVRRGRIQFVKQMPLFENSVKYAASIEYADQTDEIIQQAIRAAMSGTPGPVYIEYPSHVILEELAVAAPLPPGALSPGQPGRGHRHGSQGRRSDPRGEKPDPAGRPRGPHHAHGRGGQGTGVADELPGDPDFGRDVVHRRAGGPHLPVRVLRCVDRSGRTVGLVPRARHRTGRAGALWALALLAGQRSDPQVDLRRAGPDRDRRQPSDRCAAGGRSARGGAATRHRAQEHAAPARAWPRQVHEGWRRRVGRIGGGIAHQERWDGRCADPHLAVRRAGERGVPQGRHR